MSDRRWSSSCRTLPDGKRNNYNNNKCDNISRIEVHQSVRVCVYICPWSARVPYTQLLCFPLWACLRFQCSTVPVVFRVADAAPYQTWEITPGDKYFAFFFFLSPRMVPEKRVAPNTVWCRIHLFSVNFFVWSACICVLALRSFVIFRYQKRSRVVAGGGSKPFFREEDIVMWIDKENWTNDLHLQWDD